MSASTGDKITDTRNAARPNSARVSSSRSAGGTTLACDNLAGWPTASKVHFVTYRIDSNSAVVAGTQLDCYGIVSGNNIGSFTVVDGTDTGNAVNDVVEMLPTAAWGQDLADALTSQHTRAGAHKSITNTGGLTTDTLTVSGASTFTGVATLASPTITGTLGGAVVANANLATSTGELGAAWQSWTPTLTNITIGNGTIAGKYQQVGKTIRFRLNITLGSTSSVGTAPTFTFPATTVTYAGTAGNQQIGFLKTSGGGAGSFVGGAMWNSTTTALLQVWDTAATTLRPSSITSTNPGTWTTSDEFNITGEVEAA